MAAAAIAFAGQMAAQDVTPGVRARADFRASLTATVLMAGPTADSAGARCRVVSIEWRTLPGAADYQVQVSVGQSGLWIAVRTDPRCPGGGTAGPTTYRDRVPRPPVPTTRRTYRVVATAKDGTGLEVTTPVSVDLR